MTPTVSYEAVQGDASVRAIAQRALSHPARGTPGVQVRDQL